MHFVVTWWSVTYFWIVFSWSIASLSTFTFIQVEWVKRETILHSNLTLLPGESERKINFQQSPVSLVREPLFPSKVPRTHYPLILNGSSHSKLQEIGSSRMEVKFGLLGFCTRVGSSQIQSCSTYSKHRHAVSSIWQVLTYLGCISCVSLCLLSISSFLAVTLPTPTLRLKAARKIGMAQLVAVILLFLSLAGFPGGFGSEFVRSYCGPTSRAFNIGECEFGWNYTLLIVCAFLALYCPALVNFTFYIERTNRQHVIINCTYLDVSRSKII